MDTRRIVARFEAERQALALMDHPNIAKVHDGGETAGGRPYFVMELVKGVPVTEYCDANRLAPRERLELFLNVCEAVQHAHQKGVIHRDIKPSNVLVTSHDGKPVVKVIDFGVAKPIGQQLTDKTVYTQFAQLIGTPLYMSPEQAGDSGLDVDTRSDIYSLGVLLYELLTGTTPFDKKRLNQASFDEIRRIIRDEEPPKPSTRMSTVGLAATTASEKRGGDPRKLSRLFRRELDWIVMKALEKDRNRRYETASAFAADVQRYLNDEPVQACAPSMNYRLRKFVRRNKGPVLVAGIVGFVLLAGTAVSTWQAVRATRADHDTNDALALVTAEQTKTQEALTAETAAKALTREALDALTDDVVEKIFAKQPELDETEKAFLRRVIRFYEAFTQEAGETAEARFLRAKGYFKVAHLRDLLGEQHEAAEGYQKAEMLLEALASEFPDEPEYRQKLGRTEGNLGVVLAEIGEERDAETTFHKALDLRTDLAKEFPLVLEYRRELAASHNDLGFLLERQENYGDAEKSYQQALELEEQVVAESGDLAPYRQGLARTRSALAGLLRKQQRFDEAEELLNQAVKSQEILLQEYPGPRSRRQLADSFHGLGIVLTELNRETEAETAFHQALDLRTKLRDAFPKVLAHRRELANVYGDLGHLLRREKKYADAEKAYRQALDLRERLVAEHGSIPAYRKELARVHVGLGDLAGDQKEFDEAEKNFNKALPLQTQLVTEYPKVPAYRNELVDTLVKLALLRMQRRDFTGALPLLEQAKSHLQAALEPSPPNPTSRRLYRDLLRVLAKCYMGLADNARLASTADELARFGYEPVNDAYLAACMLCSCVRLAEKDARLDEDMRKQLVQGYAYRALALLRQAVESGFKDAAKLRQDPNLEPVRAREEFQKLLAELEGMAKS
jgi:tetratricopeptide (TPR) repeat protein